MQYTVLTVHLHSPSDMQVFLHSSIIHFQDTASRLHHALIHVISGKQKHAGVPDNARCQLSAADRQSFDLGLEDIFLLAKV